MDNTIHTYERSELVQFANAFAQSLVEEAPEAACRFQAIANMLQNDGEKPKPWHRPVESEPEAAIAISHAY